MGFSSRPVFTHKNCSLKSRDSVKTVPHILDGVSALEPTSDTMKGVLSWLLSLRLHKYWPLFSRMSYTAIVGLTEGTFDDTLARLGVRPVTNGAKRRILRCTEQLRGRFASLENINELTPLDYVADVFVAILNSPLSSTDDEPNGHSLMRMLRAKFDFLIEIHGASLFAHHKFGGAYLSFLSRPEVPDHDKQYVWERKSTFDRLSRSAGKRTGHSSHAPAVARPATSSDVSDMQSETLSQQSREHTHDHRSCSLRLAKCRSTRSLVDVRQHPDLPVTSCRSEPFSLNQENFICQPQRPVLFSAPQPVYLVSPVSPFIPARSSYPASSATSSYPASSTKSSYPASSTKSSCPASSTKSSYPASSAKSSYPASSAKSSYPASSAGSSYPASSATSSYPASSAGSSYPASSAGSSYPASSSSSYPISCATSLSSLSAETSDGQSDDSSWPANPHIHLLVKIMSHSIYSPPIDSSIDLNRIWGGVENQVMIDIASASL